MSAARRYGTGERGGDGVTRAMRTPAWALERAGAAAVRRRAGDPARHDGAAVVPRLGPVQGHRAGLHPEELARGLRPIPTSAEMFGRTFRIAVLVTLLTAVLGAPEAYILNRMKRAVARHLPAGDPRAAADLGRGAHARLGAAVRRQQRRRQQGADVARC